MKTYEDEVEYLIAKEITEWQKRICKPVPIDPKMQKAYNILIKSEKERPFRRAMEVMKIYENASKTEFLERELEKLKNRSFWSKLKGLFGRA